MPCLTCGHSASLHPAAGTALVSCPTRLPRPRQRGKRSQLRRSTGIGASARSLLGELVDEELNRVSGLRLGQLVHSRVELLREDEGRDGCRRAWRKRRFMGCTSYNKNTHMQPRLRTGAARGYRFGRYEDEGEEMKAEMKIKENTDSRKWRRVGGEMRKRANDNAREE
eukprot:6173861-Pleurochrysis_carterae.AAC.1